MLPPRDAGGGVGPPSRRVRSGRETAAWRGLVSAAAAGEATPHPASPMLVRIPARLCAVHMPCSLIADRPRGRRAQLAKRAPVVYNKEKPLNPFFVVYGKERLA